MKDTDSKKTITATDADRRTQHNFLDIYEHTRVLAGEITIYSRPISLMIDAGNGNGWLELGFT